MKRLTKIIDIPKEGYALHIKYLPYSQQPLLSLIYIVVEGNTLYYAAYNRQGYQSLKTARLEDVIIGFDKGEYQLYTFRIELYKFLCGIFDLQYIYPSRLKARFKNRTNIPPFLEYAAQ